MKTLKNKSKKNINRNKRKRKRKSKKNNTKIGGKVEIFDLLKLLDDDNDQTNSNVSKKLDPILILIDSVNNHHNKKLPCQDILKFLKNYDESKKLFENISNDEIENIIIATQNHNYCKAL